MNQIILLSLFVKFSHALVCYECDSLIHGASCMNQLNVDEIQPYQCGKTSRSNFTTDYECVREEKFYEINNRRTYVRKCQPRSTNFDYCQSLQQLGIAQGFKLEKCEVCYTDRCNSSQNVKLSLLLNLIFFYIFYECTKF